MTMTHDSITYRELHSNEEFLEIVDLQRAIWGAKGFDPMPNHIMHAVTAHGGVLAGAEHSGRLIGFAFAFPARENKGDWYLWSHIAGVHPDHQNQGIGFKLKQFQRTWAIARGFNTMGWTFDPLQRGNANFNLHLLGAITNTYKFNIYGTMTDELNAGLQSDRLSLIWHLHSPRVTGLAEGAAPQPATTEYPQNNFLIHQGDNDLPVIIDSVELTEGYYFVEAPYHINRLKHENLEAAKAWQAAFRHVFPTAFANGYTIVDFVIQDNRAWYVLSASSESKK